MNVPDNQNRDQETEHFQYPFPVSKGNPSAPKCNHYPDF